MTTYLLPSAAEPEGAAEDVQARVAEMDAALLHENAVWFCLSPSAVLRDAAPAASALPARALVWQLLSVLLIWGVIWYLVSRLAAALRRRQRELAATNVRLALSSRERMRHMLQTTHQLKAPLAAIHANTQLLLGGYCGELADAERQVVVKIADRSAALSQQIVQMLQLANLRSDAQSPPTAVELDLAELIGGVLERQAPPAAAHDVRIAADLAAAPLCTSEDHARMLIENVLSNAVAYSYPGGAVEVACGAGPDGGAEVTVRDHGIGIGPEKLPAIFDEYFRTKEAVRHNRSSTGLGLAVVRQAARMAGVAIEVASAPGKGTRVALTFPPIPPSSSDSN